MYSVQNNFIKLFQLAKFQDTVMFVSVGIKYQHLAAAMNVQFI